MFVEELDRPWLDTPFLLQGFLIDSDEQITELQHYCEYVFINPTRSIGDAYEAPPKSKIGTKAPSLATNPQVAYVHIVHEKEEKAPEEKKESLVQDIKTIFKESFARRASEKVDFENEVFITYERPELTDTRDIDEISIDFPLFAEYAEAKDPIFGKSREAGLLSRVLKTFSTSANKNKNAKTKPISSQKLFGEIEKTFYENVSTTAEEASKAQVKHERSLEILEDIAHDVREEKILDFNKVNDAVDGLLESVVRNPNALIWLTKLKNRDNYAYGHSIDVSIYMMAFGRHLGLPKEQLAHLGVSGLMQDIGKIKLPQDLLTKKGMLSHSEFDLLRRHVTYSLEILNETEDLPADVLNTVASHHERFDGSGYPRGLKGPQIGMFGTMAGIVDCFQALISHRPYASAISAHQAMQDLYTWKDKYFSGPMIEQFIQCLGIYPIGTIVELNTGDVAIVTSQNKIRKMKPQILIVLDPNKKKYSNPTLLDLINDPIAFADQPFEIKKALAPGSYGLNPKDFYI